MAKQSRREELRKLLTPTPIAVLKSNASEEDKTLNYGERSDYLSVEEGANKFRIYPKHVGEETFYVTKVVHWVTVTNDEGEAGRRSVYNGRVHGGLEKDIIEEYIKGSSKHLTELSKEGDDEAADKIKLLTDWKKGLTASTTWITYADKILKEGKEFGFFEAKKSVRDGMNKLASVEDIDEPIVVEPYTDIDEGIPIIVTYKPSAKKAADKYSVALSKKSLAISDAELDNYMDNVKSLTEVFRDCYNSNSFDLAVEGLKNFDEEYEIEYFDTEEFQEILQTIKEAIGGDEKGESKKSTKDKKSGKKRVAKAIEPELEEEEDDEEVAEEAEEEEEEEIDLSSMDRSALKVFIREQELEVKVMKSWSDDDIRDAIVTAMGSGNEEIEDEEEDDDPPPTKKPVAAKPTPAKKSESLADIKARLQAKRVK